MTVYPPDPSKDMLEITPYPCPPTTGILGSWAAQTQRSAGTNAFTSIPKNNLSGQDAIFIQFLRKFYSVCKKISQNFKESFSQYLRHFHTILKRISSI